MKFIQIVNIDTGQKKTKGNDELKGQRHLPTLEGLLLGVTSKSLPGNEHLSCETSIENGALLLIIAGPNGPYELNKPYSGETIPVLTVAVSRQSKYGARLWEKLCEIGDNPLLRRPSSPWCARLVHETAALLVSELDKAALDEFIDGISCAWLQYRRPELQKNKGDPV